MIIGSISTKSNSPRDKIILVSMTGGDISEYQKELNEVINAGYLLVGPTQTAGVGTSNTWQFSYTTTFKDAYN
jgi:hypothetical protein